MCSFLLLESRCVARCVSQRRASTSSGMDTTEKRIALQQEYTRKIIGAITKPEGALSVLANLLDEISQQPADPGEQIDPSS